MKSSLASILNLIKKKNLRNEPTFFYPSQYISPEASLCAKIFDSYFSSKINDSDTAYYLTQYSNGEYEALHGTIKIMRHNYQRSKFNLKRDNIVIYNTTKKYQRLFNPKNLPSPPLFVPGVLFFSELAEVTKHLKKNNTIGLIGFLDKEGENLHKINELIRECKSRSIYTAISEGNLENWYEQSPSMHYPHKPDVLILAENLTENLLPFGAFLIKKNFYKPLNKTSTFLLNSSCFSGNTLVLRTVIEQFKKYNLVNNCNYEKISNSKRFYYYKKYVNPIAAIIYKNANMQPSILKAFGSKVIFNHQGRDKCLYDLQTCAGSSPRGYNPKDIISLLDSHDIKNDYHNQLEKELHKTSKYPHFFPAPSGTTAIDLALILAEIARESDGYMVTFKGNYSGKSLLSINFSPSIEQRKFYKPLNSKTIHFDPYKKNVAIELEQFLSNNKVCLFLFEAVRGHDMCAIPEELLNIVSKYQEIQGYYLIIDEVLTGFFRTGEFLYSNRLKVSPDAVAIGKGTSDMAFPIAGLLVNEKLYEAAYKKKLKQS